MAAQNTLNEPALLRLDPATLPDDAVARAALIEGEQRRIYLERTEAFRQAKEGFDAVVAEIRQARDPEGFLETTVAPRMILRAAEQRGAGHALVYLAAMDHGGMAVVALAANPEVGSMARFGAIELPELTDDLLFDLIQCALPEQRNGQEAVIGGFGYAQEGSGFGLILRDWEGETFRARVQALRAACLAAGMSGTLEAAGRLALLDAQVARLADMPLAALSGDDLATLDATVGRLFLRLELRRCLRALGEVALRPLAAWLREQGVTGVTLIPCGRLGAFPLTAAEVAPGRTFGDHETFARGVSVAPSARALLRDERDETDTAALAEAKTSPLRRGVYTVGDPRPTHQPLKWGEAEALTLAKLARRLGLPAETKLGHKATRGWVLQALTRLALVFDASCHGAFNGREPLDTALLLAGKDEGAWEPERLTLRDLLAIPGLLRGLRLLILSACETAILDLRGASDEVRSLAAGTLEAGAEATMAALWAVDDRATYLLMVKFAQEWLPRMEREAPAAALGRAQHWLRTATNEQLREWQGTEFPTPTEEERREAGGEPETSAEEATAAAQAATNQEFAGAVKGERLAVRGKGEYIALDDDLETLEALADLHDDDDSGARGARTTRHDAEEAAYLIRIKARREDPQAQPYADPIYWAGFQITGW